MRTFRITTYNIHKGRGLDGRTRVERIAQVLEKINPDIVALQEVVSHEGLSIQDHQASFLAERLGHSFAIGKTRHHRGGVYGNVTLSRWGGNNATNSLAWAIGPIPHLKPVQRAVPYLETVDGPVVQNIDANTTAAFFQYVPVGVEGIDPTPGCAALPISIGGEGHYCAQRAAESLHQREVFFQTTISNGVPTIINPFAE